MLEKKIGKNISIKKTKFLKGSTAHLKRGKKLKHLRLRVDWRDQGFGNQKGEIILVLVQHLNPEKRRYGDDRYDVPPDEREWNLCKIWFRDGSYDVLFDEREWNLCKLVILIVN
jgi:hypothetical protein